MNGDGKLDYFSTTITQMPIDPNTGEEWDPAELFEHIRTNINEFVDTQNSEFSPILADETKWFSENPVSAVVSIDIDILKLTDYFGDDGSVICSQYESCCWIFSTVQAPAFPATEDGYHPVSGNRKFGYEVLPNGNMEIYTKGADRYFYPPSGSGGVAEIVGYLFEKAAFFGADDLWQSFQKGINDFANNPLNGGQANINVPVKNRPKVQDGLKILLNQNYPLNFIPCGN